MSEQFKDGTGKGYLAKVNDENQLSVSSVITTGLGHASLEHGNAFSVGTPVLAVTATGGPVLWFKHESPAHDFVIHRILMGWNGGDTNHDRVIAGSVYYGADEPSANHTPFEASNLNKGSQNSISSSAYFWDGVGDGMTIADLGTLGGSLLIGQGMSVLDMESSIIIPPNLSFAISVDPEEAGNAVLLIMGALHLKE